MSNADQPSILPTATAAPDPGGAPLARVVAEHPPAAAPAPAPAPAPAAPASPAPAPVAAPPAPPAKAAVPAKPDAATTDAAKPAPPPARSIGEIEADMAATRTRLAGTINQIEDAVKPANVAKRAMAKVTGFFTDEYGGVRPERVAMVAGGVVGLLLLRRGMRSWSAHRAEARLPDIVWVPVPRADLPPELVATARASKG